MQDFHSLDLQPTLTAALERMGIKAPTPIQARAIPLALSGRDILGIAQTGTGKTLAFGLPLTNALLSEPGKPPAKGAKALILAPTRELVNQIAANLKLLVSKTPLKVTVVVGGQSIGKQISVLSRGTDILVATPGRLIDLMGRRAVDLSNTRHLVLDEADQMLDMGFIHALRQIAPKLGTPRRTMLFSATMPKQMEELSRAYLSNPERVQVAPPGKAADKISQAVHFLEKPEKPAKLREVLGERESQRTLVFARTKHGAERLMKGLRADGFSVDSIHGNKSQGQRDRAIKAFREGQTMVLVATDVAARGIDIPGVTCVINYELPEVPENYVHRIGRTARAGADGEAIAFCAPEEGKLLRQIEKLMKIEITVASGTPSAEVHAKPKPRGKPRRKPAPTGGKPAGDRANPKRRRRPRREAA
ncbi:MAG: DEAD/DEAH box helicase [Pseudomonadota bacterium]